MPASAEWMSTNAFSCSRLNSACGDGTDHFKQINDICSVCKLPATPKDRDARFKTCSYTTCSVAHEIILILVFTKVFVVFLDSTTYRLIASEGEVQQLGKRPGDGRAHQHQPAHEPGRGRSDHQTVARAHRLRDDFSYTVASAAVFRSAQAMMLRTEKNCGLPSCDEQLTAMQPLTEYEHD